MDSLEVMRDSVLVEVMVGVRVEVDAITSVLNSQKNSGAAEDVDDKVVVGSWVGSVKMVEIISSIFSFTSSALAVVVSFVSENMSEMRDLAVSTSVASEKISEIISLIFAGSVVETSADSGDAVVVIGSNVVVDKLVEISASVVDNCERMLWSVVKRSAIVDASVVPGGSRSGVVVVGATMSSNPAVVVPAAVV